MKLMYLIKVVALILAIVGAVNWALFGLFQIDLVALIFRDALLMKVVYALVGVAGLVLLLDFAHLTKCNKE